MSTFGVGGGSEEKRVGNLAARASGVKSRFVLVEDLVGLVARSVAVRFFVGFWGLVGSVVSSSLAKSIMLFLSSSELLGAFSCSSSNTACSSSAFCRFNRSTSTDSPSPSLVSLSTLSHVLFLSMVKGIFSFSLPSRKLISLSSSRLLRKRSSRRILSVAFFLLMCRLWRFCLLPTRNARWAFGGSFGFFEDIEVGEHRSRGSPCGILETVDYNLAAILRAYNIWTQKIGGIFSRIQVFLLSRLTNPDTASKCEGASQAKAIRAVRG